MENSAEQGKSPRNLVDMFAAENKQEQKTAMDRKIKKKRFTPGKLAMYGAALIFFGFIGYQLLYGVSQSTLNVDAEKLTIATVSFGPFQEYIVEQGAVMPLTTIYLDAVEGGRVEEVFVEQGERVQEGDPILRLSNAQLQLNVMQREAELFREANSLRQTRVSMEQRRLSLRSSMVDLDTSYSRRNVIMNVKLSSWIRSLYLKRYTTRQKTTMNIWAASMRSPLNPRARIPCFKRFRFSNWKSR